MVIPSGRYVTSVSAPTVNTSYVFSTKPTNPSKCVHGPWLHLADLSHRPIAHLPSGNKPSIVVRFCPTVFARRDNAKPNPLGLSYRVLFAVATTDSLLLYDSDDLSSPVSSASGLHYCSISDVCWSPCGRYVLASSLDGYVTIGRIPDSVLSAAVDMPALYSVPMSPPPSSAGASVAAADVAGGDVPSGADVELLELAPPKPQREAAKLPVDADAEAPVTKKRRIAPILVTAPLNM